MHELSIAEELLALIYENAEKAGIKKVSEVNLRVGEFSGVLPDALQFAFEMLSQKKITEGARLNIETVSPRFICQGCHHTVGRDSCKCPHCDSDEIVAEGGHDFQIVSFVGD